MSNISVFSEICRNKQSQSEFQVTVRTTMMSECSVACSRRIAIINVIKNLSEQKMQKMWRHFGVMTAMNIVTHNGVLNMFCIAIMRYAEVYISPSVFQFFYHFLDGAHVLLRCCDNKIRWIKSSNNYLTSNEVVKYITAWICPDYRRITLPNQMRCSSVLERVGQLAIGGDDRGCSSIFVSVPTDFRCGATI